MIPIQEPLRYCRYSGRRPVLRGCQLQTMRAVLVAFAVGLIAPAAARAANEAADARAAYVDGEGEYALGHYDKALSRFEEAFKLSRKAQLLFNIAQCHRQMKNFDMAVTTY